MLNLNKQISVDVCRLCHNEKCSEKITIIKRDFIYSKIRRTNTNIINDTLENPHKIIFPCNCLLPVHVLCVFRLILVSQGMICNNCNHVFVLKFHKKIENNFIVESLSKIKLDVLCLVLFAIGFILFALIYEFSEKYIHIKYVLLIVFTIKLIVIISLAVTFSEHSGSDYLKNNKIIFDERRIESEGEKIESGMGFAYNQNQQTQANKNTNLQITTIILNENQKISFKIFASILQENFSCELPELLELKSNKFLLNKYTREYRIKKTEIIDRLNIECSPLLKTRININKLQYDSLYKQIQQNNPNIDMTILKNSHRSIRSKNTDESKERLSIKHDEKANERDDSPSKIAIFPLISEDTVKKPAINLNIIKIQNKYAVEKKIEEIDSYALSNEDDKSPSRKGILFRHSPSSKIFNSNFFDFNNGEFFYSPSPSKKNSMRIPVKNTLSLMGKVSDENVKGSFLSGLNNIMDLIRNKNKTVSNTHIIKQSDFPQSPKKRGNRKQLTCFHRHNPLRISNKSKMNHFKINNLVINTNSSARLNLIIDDRMNDNPSLSKVEEEENEK